MQRKLAQVLFRTPGFERLIFDLNKFPIKDLPVVGKSYKKEPKISFRWPTLEDLEKMNLTAPPKLTQIVTTGSVAPDRSRANRLVKIQLKFANGISSPIYDSHHPRTQGFMSYNVREEPI